MLLLTNFKSEAPMVIQRINIRKTALLLTTIVVLLILCIINTKVTSITVRPETFIFEVPQSQQETQLFLKEKVAFAMKTGIDVARDRLFAVQKAWFDRVPNRIFIADVNFTIDGINVTGVNSIAMEIIRKREEAERDENNYGKTSRTRRDAIYETQGWKSDKHKNLPGFRELYKAYPDAEWYIMVDDDTYIYLDNLVDMLSNYDSRKELYLGYTMSYGGCDTVEGFDTAFKQGGAGIILSHATMVKMMEIVEECIWKSRDCWAGDVRVATCLQHVGIRPTDNHPYIFSDIQLPNLIVNPALMRHGSACNLVISSHKMSPQTLLNLREMERRVLLTDKRFNLGEVYAFQYAGNQAILENDHYDYYGIFRDREIIGPILGEVMTGSELDCKRLCEVTPDCRAWTRSESGICSTKGFITKWVTKNGFISGQPYKCFREADS